MATVQFLLCSAPRTVELLLDDDVMLLKNQLDTLVHHLLELLAEEFVVKAHRLGQFLLLPLGELVELFDELFKLLVLDLVI